MISKSYQTFHLDQGLAEDTLILQSLDGLSCPLLTAIQGLSRVQSFIFLELLLWWRDAAAYVVDATVLLSVHPTEERLLQKFL